MPEDSKNWWKQAVRDTLSAEHSLSMGDFYVSAFLSQQAVEKGLKALDIKLHKRHLKIHDLVKLAREVEASQDIIEKCAKLNPVYAEVRYPESDELPAEKINGREAENLLNIAREVLVWIEKKL